MAAVHSSLLFHCPGDPCRSPRLQFWVNRLGPKIARANSLDWQIATESAGGKAHGLTPLAAQVMKVSGVGISTQRSKVSSKKMPGSADIELTVCNPACPVAPGQKMKLQLPFSDPAAVTGTEAEVLSKLRCVRDRIRDGVEQLLQSLAGKANVRDR